MIIPKLLEDLAIISKLGDNPGADNGLTANGLKAKFDEAVLKLQAYINNTLVESINSLFSLDAPAHDGMNMTGPINMNQQSLSNLKTPTDGGDAANKAYVDSVKETVDSALPKSGGTMTGAITTNGIILTDGVDYGDNLPSTVTPGKLFFKKVT